MANLYAVRPATSTGTPQTRSHFGTYSIPPRAAQGAIPNPHIRHDLVPLDNPVTSMIPSAWHDWTAQPATLANRNS
jgi:hypothetical protein